MILVCPHSGLGNQIGNYVFAQFLKEKGLDVKFLLTNEKNPDRAFVLDKFKTELNFASKKEVEALISKGSSFLSYRLLFKNMFLNKKIYFNSLYKVLSGVRAEYNLYPYKTPSFLSKIISYEDVLRYGIKQGAVCDCYSPIFEFYDNEFREKIKEHFILKEPLDKENEEILQRIKISKNPTGVHIRRGDYLKLKIPVVKRKFLIEKMNYMIENFEEVEFFIFSDDMDWAKENLDGFKNINFVENNDEAHGYIDFTLMNNCRHRIYSASSFSKWLLYLNPDEDSIEFMPEEKDLTIEG